MTRPTSLNLETDPEHVKQAADYLRKISDEELAQAIASPIALEGRLSGFTRIQLHTRAEDVLVAIAKLEQERRRADRIDRRSRNAFWVSIFTLLVGFLGVAFTVWRSLTYGP